MKDFKYFVMRGLGDKAYPLVKVVNEEEDDDGDCVFMELEFNTPIPRNPIMADFLSGPEVFCQND